MKAEGLARLGDRARLVNHKAGHGRRFVIGQVPAHRAIELPDGRGAIDHHRPVAQLAHALHGEVVLIANVADDLLDDVFERNEPLHHAIFVDNKGGMGLSAQKRLELVAQRRRIQG